MDAWSPPAATWMRQPVPSTRTPPSSGNCTSPQLCPRHPAPAAAQKSFAGEWHTWALEWGADGKMVWKLDDDTPNGSIHFFAQSGGGTPLGW